MGPRQMGPGQMGPRTNGSRTIGSWTNGSRTAGVKDQPSRSYKHFNICVKRTRLIRSTGWVEQPIVLLSKSIQQPVDPIKLPLVAPLECDATPIPLPLRWRRHFNVSDTSAREGVHHSNVLACSPLSHPCLKDASQCGSPGFAEQPI